MTEQTTADPNVREERLRTAYTETELLCPKCRAKWSPPVANFINFGTDPKGLEGILRRSIHHAYCPACKRRRDRPHLPGPHAGETSSSRSAPPGSSRGGEEIYWKRLKPVEKWLMSTPCRCRVWLDEAIEKFLVTGSR